MEYKKKRIKVKHTELGEMKVEVEVPQYDSMAEFLQVQGEESQALLSINAATFSEGCKNAGLKIRNFGVPKGEDGKALDLTDQKKEELRAKAQKAGIATAKGFKLSPSTRGIGQKAKADEFDQLIRDFKENPGSLTKERMEQLAKQFNV